MSLVRNVRAGDTFDVYIGRPSIWGNPFRLGIDGDRATVVQKFQDFIMGPHGDRLRERANKYTPGIFSDVGLRRCQRKGHRPPTKTGHCSRCGNFIRIEDLTP